MPLFARTLTAASKWGLITPPPTSSLNQEPTLDLSSPHCTLFKILHLMEKVERQGKSCSPILHVCTKQEGEVLLV